MEQEAGVVKPLSSSTEPSEHTDSPSATRKSGGNDVNLETGLRPDDRRRVDRGEELFYDCEESLDPPDDSKEGRDRRTGRDTEETTQHIGGLGNDRDQMQSDGHGVPQGALKRPENTVGHVESRDESMARSPDATREEPTHTGGEDEDGTWDERIEDDRTPDGDSDSEMKAKGEQVEFDDEYLREVEESLTEEEKVGRRQESLALKEEGNKHFKCGEHHDAERSYTSALGLCPVCYSKDRAVLFSNRAAARLHLDLKEKAIADCSRAIELDPDYVKAILRRAELYEKTDKLDEALDDFKQVLEKDPGHQAARQACMRLPRQIEEKNEKLKEEMMGKLKELGNMFLRPFGLSTNNFQLNQDANTGSYSVNFVQNPNNNNNG